MTNKHIIGGEEAREQIISVIKNLNLEKQWDITIKPHRLKRTLSQNNLYWAWIEEVVKYVSEYTGYEKDEVHTFFKDNFLPGSAVEIEGLQATHRSTQNLDTKQMAEFMNRIYRWATSELGLVLPLPPIQTEIRS